MKNPAIRPVCCYVDNRAESPGQQEALFRKFGS